MGKAKSDNLSSGPPEHRRWEKLTLASCPLTSTYTLWNMRPLPPTNSINKRKKRFLNKFTILSKLALWFSVLTNHSSGQFPNRKLFALLLPSLPFFYLTRNPFFLLFLRSFCPPITSAEECTISAGSPPWTTAAPWTLLKV